MNQARPDTLFLTLFEHENNLLNGYLVVRCRSLFVLLFVHPMLKHQIQRRFCCQAIQFEISLLVSNFMVSETKHHYFESHILGCAVSVCVLDFWRRAAGFKINKGFVFLLNTWDLTDTLKFSTIINLSGDFWCANLGG